MAKVSCWLLQYVHVATWLLACPAFATNSTSALSRHLKITSSETKAVGSLLGHAHKSSFHDMESDIEAQRRIQQSWTLQQPPTEVDVTLVIQTSEDRQWLLPHSCDRWDGPISIVVLVGSANQNLTLAKREAMIASECMRLPAVRDFTSGDHTFSAPQLQNHTGKVSVQAVQKNASLAEYPVNLLRNFAVREVATTHYLVVDVDFLPSGELYHELKSLSQSSPEEFGSATQALVVPAFRMAGVTSKCLVVRRWRRGGDPVCAADFVKRTPKTFEELLICVARNLCRPFDWVQNPWGHSSTDYPAFFKKDRIRDISCFDSNKYEPYLVLSKEGGQVPMYDEAFTGYGKNKIEHVMLLRANGFKFSVLPKVFLIHLPHPRSKAKRQWDDEKKNENGKLLREIESNLKKHSNLSSSNKKTHLCKPSRRALGKYPDVWAASVETARASLKALSSRQGIVIANYDLSIAPGKSDRLEEDAIEKGDMAKKQLEAMREYERQLVLDSSKVHKSPGCKQGVTQQRVPRDQCNY